MAFRTLKQLRVSAAQVEQDHWAGSIGDAVTEGQTQIAAPDRHEGTRFFANFFIQLGEGAEAEHLRLINNGAGQLVTALPGATAAHDAGSYYEIHRIASAVEYNQFIVDAALDVSAEAILGNKESTSLTITTNAAKVGGIEDEYTVPTGFRYINEIAMANAQGAYTEILPLNQVSLLPGATKRMRFSPWLTGWLVEGRSLRILGMGEQDVSAIEDDDLIMADPSYVREYVRLQLLELLSSGSGARAQAALNRIRTQAALVELKKASATSEQRALPGSIVVPL